MATMYCRVCDGSGKDGLHICCNCNGAGFVPEKREDLTPERILELQKLAKPKEVGIPTDRQARKDRPIARGVLDYFPDALAEVAYVSFIGNEQHNPGQPMHWSKHLSSDEADALVRHLLERGKVDTDGCRHSAKVAWRALALLQREIDAEKIK